MAFCIEEYLKGKGLDPYRFDMDDAVNTFMAEMTRGLCAQKSSLKMIPAYVQTDGELPKDKPVIVLDMGGTNFRAAVVKKGDAGWEISDFNKHKMPGVEKEISADEFFDIVAEVLRPIIDRSDIIGYCFSYPAQMESSLDGRVISFCKEVKIRDAQGLLIGETLRKKLAEKGLPSEKRVVIANDTVTTLLSGMSAAAEKSMYDSYVGFILGTGTNTAYIEQVDKIQKLRGFSGSSMVINMESGAYDKIARTCFDNDLHEHSDSPNVHVLEKMCSGAYFGELTRFTLLRAARGGLFSPEFARRIEEMPILETYETDVFVNSFGKKGALAALCQTDKDFDNVYKVIDILSERAANIVCANLSAVAFKTGKGKSPLKPICYNIDGSMFYKSALLGDKIRMNMTRYLNAKGVYFRFTNVEDSPIIGAAIAGLLGGVQ